MPGRLARGLCTGEDGARRGCACDAGYGGRRSAACARPGGEGGVGEYVGDVVRPVPRGISRPCARGAQVQGQGLKVILVSADDDEDMAAVKKFLAEEGVDFPAYIKAEKDQPFIDGLGKQWTGALPATFLYDGSGKLHDFWEGGVTFNVFEQKVVEVLRKQENQQEAIHEDRLVYGTGCIGVGGRQRFRSEHWRQSAVNQREDEKCGRERGVHCGRHG